MTTPALALYQQIILEHGRTPRNAGALEAADARVAHGDNPLCGDSVVLHVALDGDRVERVRHETVGCAICTASASVLTERVAGVTVAVARARIAHQRGLVAGELEPDAQMHGAQAAFAGVAAHRPRHRCALLAWRALEAALDGDTATVTTES